MKVFLDDNKEPSWYNDVDQNTCVSRTGAHTLYLAANIKEPFEILYLDHDLGEGITGYTVLAKLIEELNLPPRKVVIISLNPVGVKRIISLCETYDIPVEIHGIDFINSNVSIIKESDEV